MKTVSKFVAICAIAAIPALAVEPATKEKLVVEGTVVALKDGGAITVGKDGKTYHTDAAGKRVRMKDGAVMLGADGRQYLHKNDVIWAQITAKGTMAPNR